MAAAAAAAAAAADVDDDDFVPLGLVPTIGGLWVEPVDEDDVDDSVDDVVAAAFGTFAGTAAATAGTAVADDPLIADEVDNGRLFIVPCNWFSLSLEINDAPKLIKPNGIGVVLIFH